MAGALLIAVGSSRRAPQAPAWRECLEIYHAVEPLLHVAQRRVQPRLTDANRQIAARLLEDAARRVGGAAQVAGDSVGIVERDEQRVDLVHIGQQLLARLELAKPHAVEHIAAQLADGLAQPIQIGRPLDAQIIRRRQRLALDEGAGERRFGIFLLGVGDEAGMEDVLVLAQIGSHLAQQRAGVTQELGGGSEFVAMRGSYGIRAQPDGRARLWQRALASGMLRGKVLLSRASDCLEVWHVSNLCSGLLRAAHLPSTTRYPMARYGLEQASVRRTLPYISRSAQPIAEVSVPPAAVPVKQRTPLRLGALGPFPCGLMAPGWDDTMPASRRRHAVGRCGAWARAGG